MTETARLGLPLIEPGQAQKEWFHNEALLLLDAGVQATAASAGGNTPPAAAATGACYLVGPAPTGEWAGHALALATWTPGGWRFVPARDGMAVWVQSSAALMRFLDGDWRRGSAIGNVSGGTTVDAQARAAINQMLVAMRSHGLIPT